MVRQTLSCPGTPAVQVSSVAVSKSGSGDSLLGGEDGSI
jgi:hypothetical protein